MKSENETLRIHKITKIQSFFSSGKLSIISLIIEIFGVWDIVIVSEKMGLESTIICVDNSEFMRNGDYLPTRLQAQQVAHIRRREMSIIVMLNPILYKNKSY